MLDIKFIRENKAIIKEAARKKLLDFDVEALLEADNQRLKLVGEVEKLRARQNEASHRIAKVKDEAERDELIEQINDVKTLREGK